MTRRIVMVLAAAVAAAAVVGLSSAAVSRTTTDATPTKASPPTASTSSQTVTSVKKQSSVDAAAYWTKERMEAATPKAKQVPGGSPSTQPKPEVTGVSPQAVAPTAKPSKRSTSKAKASASDGVVTKSSDTQTNGAGYWTPELMNDASPMEKTVDGGGGPTGSPDQPTGVISAGTP
jgi:hypothetical protein